MNYSDFFFLILKYSINGGKKIQSKFNLGLRNIT